MKQALMLLMILLLWSGSALAFANETCGEGKCIECHKLETAEAQKILAEPALKVLGVENTELPGFWMVDVEQQGRKFPVFIHYTKNYIFSGNVLRVSDRVNLAAQRQQELEWIDVSKIPTDDALVIGRRDAKTKVIVFTDPNCPYCLELHKEMQNVVVLDPQIAFLVKLYPLRNLHPQAYDYSRTILCAKSNEKSLALLEKSYAGETLPAPTCDTKAVDANIALAQKLGIYSTPTVILPDGNRLKGRRNAEDLLKVLGSKVNVTPLPAK